MNQPQQQGISQQQVAEAAAAGLRLFDLDTTLVPGNLRKRIGVLELILQELATGRAVVGQPEQPKVQSPQGPQPVPDEETKSAENDPAIEAPTPEEGV